jgi:hypothetical protein
MEVTKEQLLAAYEQAPKEIQDSLDDGAAMDFMFGVQKRYDMHIDVSGKVIEHIQYMLLGLLAPGEFINNLIALGIDKAVAQQITADLNKEVFIPLRDQIKHTGGTFLNTTATTLPQTPSMQVFSPPAAAQKQPQQEVSSIPRPSINVLEQSRVATTQPATPQQQETWIPPQAQSSSAASVAPAHPQIRTMQHDMELIQHPGSGAVLPSAQATPARAFQTASVPFTAVPIPTTPTPIPVPHQEITRQISQTPPTSAPQHVLTPVPGGADPYREPI